MHLSVVASRMKQTMANLNDLRIDRPVASTRPPNRWMVVTAVVVAVVSGVSLTGLRGKARAIQVQTAVACDVRRPIEKTVLDGTGYVVARRMATPSSKITGKVVEVLIEEGMKVAEGQVLARLDSPNISASLRLAEAQTVAAESALKEVSVRLNEAQKELERIAPLVAAGVASKAESDRARAEADSLKARLEYLSAQVTVAEREVAIWQQQMDDTTIRAPFSGVVVAKNAQPGEMISPVSGGGFTRSGICTIVDMNSLEIEVEVKESYINLVQPGQSVQASLDAYPDLKIACRVIAVIPTADRSKSTVKVRIGIPGPDPRVLPQMSVKVAFSGSDENPVNSRGVTIPAGAVRNQEGQPYAFVVRGGRLEKRCVTLGSSTGSEVVVLAGLNEGEAVVIEGPEHIAHGNAVEERK